MVKNNNKKIALISGGLDLPFFARDSLRNHGWDVYVIGLKNYYHPDLDPDIVVRIGSGGKIARILKKRGITTLCFLGAIGHINLSDIIPDLWSIGILASVIKNQKGYDSMGVTLIQELYKRGFKVVAAQNLVPDLSFQNPGVQTKTKPSAKDKKDIERATEVSKIIGGADIGASVVVDKQVIAVEAAEGTAQMLKRVLQIRKGKKRKSGTFAKMTKPNQEIRIDAAAIGVDTVKNVAAANLRGIIVHAKSCFVVNMPEVIKTADKLGIFIVAV